MTDSDLVYYYFTERAGPNADLVHSVLDAARAWDARGLHLSPDATMQLAILLERCGALETAVRLHRERGEEKGIVMPWCDTIAHVVLSVAVAAREAGGLHLSPDAASHLSDLFSWLPVMETAQRMDREEDAERREAP